MRLFKVFQDVRLLLVPAFLTLLHLAMSSIMLYTNAATFHILRDVLGDVAGCLLLGMVIWVRALALCQLSRPLDVLLEVCLRGVEACVRGQA